MLTITKCKQEEEDAARGGGNNSVYKCAAHECQRGGASALVARYSGISVTASAAVGEKPGPLFGPGLPPPRGLDSFNADLKGFLSIINVFYASARQLSFPLVDNGLSLTEKPSIQRWHNSYFISPLSSSPTPNLIPMTVDSRATYKFNGSNQSCFPGLLDN